MSTRSLLLVALVALACDGEQTKIPEDVPAFEDDCADGLDNDRDGKVDCADRPDCDQDCLPDTETLCDDAEDDDADGLVDCRDPDCVEDEACLEDCTNGTDDDGDSLIDCADTDCQGDAACVEDCGDLSDNDRDGLTDCDDPDCAEACVEDCENGVDDDQDGLTDCDDADDCEALCEEVCDNDIDDDGDDLIDCADDECEGEPACDEVCDNGRDDDVDGLTDCEDADCVGDPACDELCANGDDDDFDGLTDCEDDDCWADPACETTTLTVTGGRMAVDAVKNYSLVFNFTTYFVNSTSVATASVLGGEGRILIANPASSVGCDWSFTRAVFSGNYGGNLSLVSRLGFRTSGACGGIGSSILPTSLERDSDTLRIPSASRVSWYRGRASYSTGTAFSTTHVHSTFSFTFIRRNSHHWVVPTITGGPWEP